MARPDIYQILINIKNLPKMKEFMLYQQKINAVQRQSVATTRGATRATEKSLPIVQNVTKYSKQHGLMLTGLSGNLERTKKGQLVLNKTWGIASQALDRHGKVIGTTLKAQDRMGAVTLKTTQRYQAMGQIIGKVAVWAVATTAIYGTIKAIRTAAKIMEDYAVAMARISTVTRGSAEDIGKLSGVILSYAMGSKAALGDIAKAMYLLGSAGLTVEEQTAGLKHVMDLTVGTFGDIEQVGRLVAGSYNVFGKRMKGLISISARFKRISDILAYTYSTQQVELSEIAGAFTIVGAASSILAIDFKTLVGTLGALNSGMLKGTRAGTSLMSSFLKIAQNSTKLGKAFDIAIDPSRPLDFVDVMNQLHASIGGAIITTDQFKTLMQLFGLRGARSIASIIGRFDEWKKAINVTDATFKDFAENMKNTVEYTLGGAWQKFSNLIKTEIIELFQQEWGEGGLVKTSHALLKAAENARSLVSVIKSYTEYAKASGVNTKEMERNLETMRASLIGSLGPIRKFWKFTEMISKTELAPTAPIREFVDKWKKSWAFVYGSVSKDMGKLAEFGKLPSEYWATITQRIKDAGGKIKETLEPHERFEEVIKKIAVGYTDINKGIEHHKKEIDSILALTPEYVDLLGDEFNLTLLILEAKKEVFKQLQKQSKEENEVIKRTRESLKTIMTSAKYIKMQISGYSEVKIQEEKIVDAQEKIEERSNVIVGILEERVRLGKATDKEIRRYESALMIIQKLHLGILDTKEQENILAMQTLGLQEDGLKLTEKQMKLENLRTKANQTQAEWIATADKDSRKMFDTLKAQTNQAKVFGRAFPPLSEEMKKFVAETPAARKFLEREFEIPVSIIITKDPFLALRKYRSIMIDIPEIPTPRAPYDPVVTELRKFNEDFETNTFELNGSFNPRFYENILYLSETMERGIEIKGTVDGKIVEETVEEYDAATSKSRRTP